jgi:PurA ssDNA and RNA-binding protein
VASHIPDPEEFAQISPIFLPFPKTDAVESTASEEMDNIIEARELQIERKHFYVELRENERGRFLRITEEAHGRRNSIIVPSTGVDDFTAIIAEVLTNNEGAPA